MKCIILVGGYATRLQNITKKYPKALLKIKDSTILDLVFDNIEKSTNLIDEYILITNDNFYNLFINWKKEKKINNIKVINDGSTCNEKKVGATSALIQTIKKLKIKDDIFVLAGDNILDFSLKYIFDEFHNNNYSNIMYYIENDINKLKRTGVIEIDQNGIITNMEEKPPVPKTNYAVPPFYWINKKDVKILLEKTSNKEPIDSMGIILSKLCKYTKIKAIKMTGNRYSIGTEEEYYNYIKK